MNVGERTGLRDQFSVRVPTLADHLRDTARAVNEARAITAALEACPRCGGSIVGAVGSVAVRCAACGWRGERAC